MLIHITHKRKMKVSMKIRHKTVESTEHGINESINHTYKVQKLLI